MSTLEFSQLLGNYGEFVGAIAIVATLIYLAVQLKQNTATVRANAYQEWSASNVAINLAVSNPDQSRIMVAGNRASTNLTDETFIAFGMTNMAIMQMAQSTDYLYRLGLLDRELWEAEMNRVAGILGAPGVRQWWDAGGRTQLTPRFAELLESTQSSIAYWGWDAERGFFQHDEWSDRAPT
jgi:hypothetical protein